MNLEKILIDGTENGESVAEKINAVIDLINSGNIGIGANQTWQDMTVSRVKNVEYINDTGRPIMIYVAAVNPSDNWSIVKFRIDGIEIKTKYNSVGTNGSFGDKNTIIVPTGSTYEAEIYDGLHAWFELR